MKIFTPNLKDKTGQPLLPITRNKAPVVVSPKATKRVIDLTPVLFMPCWVQGQTERKLGYIVCLAYPVSTVNVPGHGIIEVRVKNLQFIIDPQERNEAYATLNLHDTACSAVVVVNTNPYSQEGAR